MAPKPADQRREEAARLASQLVAVGLPLQDLSPVLDKLRAFANEGVGASGTVPAAGFAVHYLLSTQAHVTSFVRIAKPR